MPERPSFEPILLDLSDMRDYVTLLAALEGYQASMESDADREESTSGLHSAWGDRAKRAKALIESIESQRDANREARQQKWN